MLASGCLVRERRELIKHAIDEHDLHLSTPVNRNPPQQVQNQNIIQQDPSHPKPSQEKPLHRKKGPPRRF